VTDEADLLRGVFATPDDDLPRLVYADWLEEHATGPCERCAGEKFIALDADGSWQSCPRCNKSGTVPDDRRERAAFIRVQVELARLEASGWHDDWKAGQLVTQDPIREHGEKIAALRKRERELLIPNWGRWRPPVLSIMGDTIICRNIVAEPDDVPMPGDVVIEFRRGFVESVTCPLAALLGVPCGCDRGKWRNGNTCPDCSGTGRVGGCGKELFASQPVLSVTLSDREPDGSDDGNSPPFAYYLDAPRLTYESRRSVLPAVLFDRLGGELSPHRSWRDFPTRDAALDAISAALVQWGRRLAGLTALPSPSQTCRTPRNTPG